MDLLGLLIECADALKVPLHDCEERKEHLRILSIFINSKQTPNDIKKILVCISDIFLDIQRDWITFAMEPDNNIKKTLFKKTLKDLSNDLSKILDELQAPKYIYHGTIYGNLKSIKQNGLVPGFKPIWKEQKGIRERSNKAVFFSSTWRVAAEWADMAHAKSRGPRKSQNRLQVVIRISYRGLKIEPDNLTIKPGNLMVYDRVSSENADVFIGPLEGYPKWQPLSYIIRSP